MKEIKKSTPNNRGSLEVNLILNKKHFKVTVGGALKKVSHKSKDKVD